jgi:hypothetical protein
MLRPDTKITKALGTAVRQHPELLLWLENILTHEMKRLPYAVDNPAVFQGRCQMISELIEFAKESPALAAKL